MEKSFKGSESEKYQGTPKYLLYLVMNQSAHFQTNKEETFILEKKGRCLVIPVRSLHAASVVRLLVIQNNNTDFPT